jgi:hypothetical protein
MKVCYLIQTYKNPEQIYRLVRTIKESTPDSYILISHNFAAQDLDVRPLQDLQDVTVISAKGGRGDFALAQAYLEAIEWLLNHNIQFDWLTNLTGQDYPIQPLPQVEKFLAETKYDGFLEHFNVLANCETNLWGVRNGSDRYLYQYQRAGSSLPRWQRALVKLPRMVINNIQPWLRVDTSYGWMIGLRAKSSPFNDNFRCYAGSYFHTISRKCVEYLHYFVNQNSELVNFYKKTWLPEESFIQTVLANSGLFNLANDNKRYIDWTNTRHGHPRLLSAEDYPAIMASDSHFARKIDMAQDKQLLDLLDEKVLSGQTFHSNYVIKTVLNETVDIGKETSFSR